MATGRRDFLKLGARACLMAGASARAAVAGGHEAGRVVFCRVSAGSRAAAIDWLRAAFDGETPVAVDGKTLRYRGFIAAFEESNRRELVICGTEATVVVDAGGSRRYSR